MGRRAAFPYADGADSHCYWLGFGRSRLADRAPGRLNLPIGRLPGDIVYRGKNTTFYFPWVTCILLSLLGTLLLWLFNRR